MSANLIYLKSRDEWRKWLEKNHGSEKEVWLIYFKKHTGKPSVSYNDAVEEALCFGWIDSTVKTIDSERYCQKYTPRNKKSNWSELNKTRARKLILENKMTEAGLEKLKGIDLSAQNQPNFHFKFSDQVEHILKSNTVAWENFRKLAPSYQQQYADWIMSAKKEETQMRRLSDAIKLLKDNKPLGMR